MKYSMSKSKITEIPTRSLDHRVYCRTGKLFNAHKEHCFPVPPHQLLIYDSSGVQVESTAGPFQVGVEFELSCEVRGGKFFLSLIDAFQLKACLARISFFFSNAGKPTPVVSWLVNEKEIDSRLEEIGRNIVVSKLRIPQLRREHRNTTYKCRAANTNLIPPLEKTVLLDVYRMY